MKKLIVLILVLIASQNVFAQSGWQWQNPLPQGNDLRVVKFLNADYGFAAGVKGTVLKTTNGGINWNFTNFNFDTQDIQYISIIDSNIVYAATFNANIYKTTDGGSHWIFISYVSPEINCLTFLNANTGFAVIDEDKIKKTTDGGFTWTLSYTLSSAICEIKFITDQIGFFTVREYVAASNSMWRTTNQGATWASCMTNPTFEQCRKMSFINSTTGYLVKVNTSLYENILLKTTDAGGNWLQISVLPIEVPHSRGFYFDMKPDGNGYIGFALPSSPYFNVIYKTTNFGMNWIQAAILPLNGGYIYRAQFNYPVCDFPESGLGYYVSNGGLILKTTNFGMNWSNKTSVWGTLGQLRDITFVNESTGYICGAGGTLLKTTNTGVNWNLSLIGNYNLTSLFFLNAETGFVGSQYERLFKTTNGGTTWDTIFFVTNYRSIDKIQFVNSATGFTINSGALYKTTNSGSNWTWISQVGGDCFHFINSETGFIAHIWGPPGNGSTIYKTTNGGANWLNTDIPGIYITDITFVSELTGYTNNSSLGITKTIDGGNTWFPVLNSVDNYKIQFLDSNTIYSGSYKSNDGGAHWTLYKTKIQEGLYYYSPNKTYYVNNSTGFIIGGNGAGILRTTDGGEIISSIYSSQTSSQIPEQFLLKQNYPNPFNPSTRINYELRNSNYVSLKVFDLLGKEVATLVNEKQNAGSYAVDFNSTEFNLPSGIYFYTLNAGEFKETKKMVLIK